MKQASFFETFRFIPITISAYPSNGFSFFANDRLSDGPGTIWNFCFGSPLDPNSTFSLSLCKARRKPLHENDSIPLKENSECILSLFYLRLGERLMRLELANPLAEKGPISTP
jgi:hypothetical protein